jgi:hypothetical protein
MLYEAACRVGVEPIRRLHEFGQHSTVQRERCTLVRVIPVLELAVRTVEVFPVEADVTGDLPIIDLDHGKVRGLVSGVVGAADPNQCQAVASNGPYAPVEVWVLLEEALSGSASLGNALDGVTAQSSPIVVHKSIGLDCDGAVDVVGLHRQT